MNELKMFINYIVFHGRQSNNIKDYINIKKKNERNINNSMEGNLLKIFILFHLLKWLMSKSENENELSKSD